MSPKFQTIFIHQPTHDFAALAPYSQNVVFITTGKEKSLSEIQKRVVEMLRSFDPKQDAVVATGKVYTSIIVGIELAKRFKGQTINIGLYQNQEGEKDYLWQTIQI